MEGAAEDAIAIQHLARLVGQGRSTIEQLIATAMRGIGAPLLPAIAAAPGLESGKARELLDRLSGLPSLRPMSETGDRDFRFGALDRLLLMSERASRRGPGGLLEIIEHATFRHWGWTGAPSTIYLVPATAIDWEAALRQANRIIDLQLVVLRAGTAEERRLAYAEVEAEQERLSSRRQAVTAHVERAAKSEATATADRVAAIDELGGTAEGRRQLTALTFDAPRFGDRPELIGLTISWNEGEAQFRLGVLAVATHRLEHGGYPADLEPARLASPAPGYVLSYHAGPQTAGAEALHRTFALVAVPEESGLTGNRAFCVDSMGALQETQDHSRPRLVNGVCAAE